MHGGLNQYRHPQPVPRPTRYCFSLARDASAFVRALCVDLSSSSLALSKVSSSVNRALALAMPLDAQQRLAAAV